MQEEMESGMTQKNPMKTPSKAATPQKTGPSDPTSEPTYPAGQHRASPDDTEKKRSQKQAGQDLRDPQTDADQGE